MLTRLDRFAAALVAATFGLLIFGASVRVHGAGLACPDWPLCFGKVLPPIDFGVGFEFGHRVLAGTVSTAFLVLSGLILWDRQRWGRGAVALIALAAAALVAQIVLGGLTVLQLLAEWTVASHLIGGNAFCLLLLLLALHLRERVVPVRREAISPAHRAVSIGLALLVPAQLALGGLVSSSHMGLASGTWPTCDGTNWFPMFSGPVGLQIVHRLTAYALLAIAVTGAAIGQGRGRVGRAELVAFAAVAVQASIGIANVLLRLPVEVTLLHTAGAASVVLATTWLNWEVWRSPVAVTEPSALAMEGR